MLWFLVPQLPPHFGGDHRYLDVCQQHQLTWSPASTLTPFDHTLPALPDTVRELEGLYRSIQMQQSQQVQMQPHGALDASRRASFDTCGAQPPPPSYPTWRLGKTLRVFSVPVLM